MNITPTATKAPRPQSTIEQMMIHTIKKFEKRLIVLERSHLDQTKLLKTEIENIKHQLAQSSELVPEFNKINTSLKLLSEKLNRGSI